MPATGSDRLWIAGLWALCLGFFWPIVAGDQTLYHRDVLVLGMPQAHLTVRALLAGELPHWEPLMGLGYPYQSDPHSMVFYPPAALLFAMPLVRGYNVFVALHFALAATFVFLLLRRWDLGRTSAALGAVAYAFSGYLLSAIGVPMMFRGSIWPPLAMLVFDRFLETREQRRMALTATVLALQGSGSDPQYLVFSVVLMALVPWLSPRPRPGWRPWLGGLLGAALLAIGLLSYQYVPLAQLLAHSDRTAGMQPGELTMFDQDPWNLASMAVPLPFPDPATAEYTTSFHGRNIPLLHCLYWGVPVLSLALASLGWLGRAGRSRPEAVEGESRREPSRRHAALALLGCSALGLLLATGSRTGVFEALLTVVPPLRLFRYPVKYLYLTAFSVPVLAAMGFEGVLGGRRACIKWLVGSLVMFTLAGSGVLVALLASGTELPRAYLEVTPELAASASGALLRVRDGWIATLGLACAVGLVCLLGAWSVRSGRLTRERACMLLALVAAGDLVITGRGAVPLAPEGLAENIPVTTSYVEAPEAGRPPPRYIPYGPSDLAMGGEWTYLSVITAHRQLLSFLSGVRYGLASVTPASAMRTKVNRHMADVTRGLQGRALDRAAAGLGAARAFRIYFSDDMRELGRVLGRDGPIVIQELEEPLPRAFIAGRAEPLEPGQSPGLAELLDLPEAARFDSPGGRPAESAAPSRIGLCRIIDYRRHSVRIEFELEGRGMLVLADAFYPGWRAKVDGAPRPIHRVAGLFRGVEVQGGERILELDFVPLPFRVGLGLTLAAAILTLALAGSPSGGRRQSSPG